MQSLRFTWARGSEGLLSFGSLTYGALLLSLLALAPIGLVPRSEAAASKGSQEVVSLRTARSETFIDDDGKYHTNTYTRSINYKRAGTWRPIDNRLVQSDRKGFRYRNAANSFYVHFKESLDSDFMRFETPRGKAAIEVSLEKAEDVAALKRSSNGLSYRGVRKKTDIRYDVTADGVKETVVLHDADAPSSYVFDIRPEEGQDLRAAKQRDGSIRFFAEGDDEPVFSIAAPTVADSDEASAPNSPAPEMTWMEIAKRDDGSFRLEVSIDPKWLRDPARVFPVYLDPNYNISTQQDAYYITKIDGAPQDSPPVTSASSLNVGHDFQGSPYYGYKNYIFKSVARFDLSSIPIGSNVTAVTPSLYLDGCLYPSSCSSGSHVGTVQMRRLTSNWLPAQPWGQAGSDGTILASRYFNAASDQVNNRYQLTPSGDGLRWAVNEMVGERMSNHGFLFEKDSESGNGFTFASSRKGSNVAPMLSISWLPTGVVMPGGTSASPHSVHANGAELSWSVWGGVYPSAIAADAPAAYYRLNEGSGTSAFDSSGREKTGTYVNTTLNQVGAVPGGDKAASFNGANSYAITPSMLNPMSSGGKSETIEVWFKPNGAGVIVDELGSTNPNSGWHDSALEILPNGEVMARVWNVSPVSLGVASFGAWHHAVLRYDENNNTLDGYLDGKKYQGTVGARAVPWEHGYNLHFALGATDATNLGSGAYFNGSLDEFAVFSQALTDERIRAHFKAGVYQRYEIHRSRTNEFSPSASTLIGTINDPGLTTYRDTTAAASSSFYYKIVAQTAAGPSISNQVVAALPAWNAQNDDPKDKPIAPQAAISYPGPGSQVKGTVTLKGAASDDSKVSQVYFILDGSHLSGLVSGPPYQYAWNTTGVARGQHTLNLAVIDDAGNTTWSPSVPVIVANSAAPTANIATAIPPEEINGDWTITANASDDYGVDHVDFLADGKFFARDDVAPWATYTTSAPQLTYSAAVLSDSPLSYWRLNEASGATGSDASGNNLPITYSGATLGVPGALNTNDTAADFNGNAYAGRPIVTTSTGNVTLEAWVKWTGTSASSLVLYNGSSGSNGYGLLVGNGSCGLGNKIVILTGGVNCGSVGATIPSNAWVHVAATRSGSTWRLYLNGTMRSSGNVNSNAPSGSTLLAGNPDSGKFTGSIDEVALYSTALSEARVLAHYQAATKPKSPTSFYRVPVYDGTHRITARVFDADGNYTTSAAQPVTVSNTTGTEYSASIETSNVPIEMRFDPQAGAQDAAPLKVDLENTSQQAWTSADVKLRYRWLNSDGSVFSTSDDIPLGGDIAAGASAAVPVPINVDPPALPASVMRGRFTLRIDLYDAVNDKYFAARGNQPFEQQVTVTRVQPDELGFERYQQYDGTDLGSNFGASVNLANGNLVVESTLSRQPGIGLDTVAELNYNSLEQGSVSPVGNNWSLAISGLTPFGLPLDIHPNPADTAAGRTEKWIGLTDGDGSYHRFTLDAAGHFYDAPPGVHLYARETTNPAGYAFTKPDRTTFNFDSAGYPTSVVDKNGNQITYTLDDIPAGQDANGLTKKITAVRDEGGRRDENRASYDIGYFDPSNTSRPGLWGKVSYIEDHLNHKFVFAYYDDGNLMSVIEQGGQNADGSYLAERTVVFNYTNQDGDGPAIATLAARRSPDPATPQSARLYSVIDARGNETSFSYFGPGAKEWRARQVTNRTGDASSIYDYDLANSKTSVTQPPGGVWSYAFDAKGRLTSFDDPITRPLAKATLVEWSADNNVTKVTEPASTPAEPRFVQYQYNQNGYLTSQKDELGNETTTEFENLSVDGYDTTKHLSRIKSVVKPQGNTTRFGYSSDPNDKTDNVLTVTDPSGSVSTTTYKADGSGLLATQTQPNAGDGITRTTTYNTYDANGLPTKVTDPALNVSNADYDAAGNLLWQQDPNHQSYSGGVAAQYRSYYYYDSYGRVGRTSTPKSTSLYPGLLIWEDTRYDANDNVLEDWNAHYGAGDGGFAPSATTQYDALDRPTLVTSQRGSKTQTFYDEAGRVRRVVQPNGYGQSQYFSEIVTSYDLLDRPYQTTEYASGQDARTTTYCYDLAGDLRSSTAPRGSTLDMACPAIGTGAYTPTSAGYTSKFEYDAAHRQVKQIAPGDAFTRVEYDANGQVVKSWDENGNLTETTYDGRGLPTKTVEPFDGARKITTLTEYDPLGRVKREISPRAFDTGGPSGPYTYYVTGYSYDALSSKTTTTLPIGPGEPQRYIHQSYDANGSQTMISLPTAASSARSISPLDKTVTSYLDTGSIYSTLDGSSGYTNRYDYTAEGWQSTRWPEIANAAGSIELSKAIHWDYKPDGPLAVVRDPQGQRETYSYDASGNEIQAREESGGPEILIERTFNGFNELTQVRAPDSTYPGFVRDTRYTYDRNGNTVSELVNDGELGSGRTFAYEYNQRDQAISQTDDFSTPASASDDEKLTYAYTQAGQLSSRSLFKRTGSNWAPEHEARTTYYENGLLRQRINYAGSVTLVEEHSLSYIYNGIYFNGNKVNDTFRIMGPDQNAICRTSTCTSFWQYDGQDRLTYEYSGNGDPTFFTLDAAGNVTLQRTGFQTTTSTYIGQRLDRQTGPDGDPYRFIYDAQGNLACKVYESSWDSTACPTVGKTYLESYAYDYKNRLTAYARYGVQSELKEQTSYTLDSLDRTVSKTENYIPYKDAPQSSWETTTTTTTYDGDSSRVVEERLTGGPGKKTYAYDAFGETITLSDSTTVGQYQPAARYSYLYDPGSSVSLVVDSQGQVKESYGYSAYGSPNNAITKSASGFQVGNVPTNPVRFQGKRFDSGSGSYDMGARRYSAQTGRWLQQDMYYGALDNLGLSQDPLTANRYAFLGANPVNYVEFDGHFGWKGIKSGAGSAWRGAKRGGNWIGCQADKHKAVTTIGLVTTGQLGAIPLQTKRGRRVAREGALAPYHGTVELHRGMYDAGGEMASGALHPEAMWQNATHPLRAGKAFGRGIAGEARSGYRNGGIVGAYSRTSGYLGTFLAGTKGAGAGASVASRGLFARSTGLLNRNNHVRVGWGWKGSATGGNRVFRVAIGNKRGLIHKHIDLYDPGKKSN